MVESRRTNDKRILDKYYSNRISTLISFLIKVLRRIYIEAVTMAGKKSETKAKLNKSVIRAFETVLRDDIHF